VGGTAGEFSVLVGVIIAALFHALNLALGAFSPTIHSLRLHYVEFFSKFYQTGGQAFHPFRRSLSSREPPYQSGIRRVA
jgi:V/A-type H+-transporting ATPase subunit I